MKNTYLIFSLPCTLQKIEIYVKKNASRIRGAVVSHYVDNQGALYCAIDGRSADPDMNRLVFLAQMRVAQLNARVWFDYVPSASNAADLPTRLDDAAYRRLSSLARCEGTHVPPT